MDSVEVFHGQPCFGQVISNAGLSDSGLSTGNACWPSGGVYALADLSSMRIDVRINAVARDALVDARG